MLSCFKEAGPLDIYLPSSRHYETGGKKLRSWWWRFCHFGFNFLTMVLMARLLRTLRTSTAGSGGLGTPPHRTDWPPDVIPVGPLHLPMTYISVCSRPVVLSTCGSCQHLVLKCVRESSGK